MSLRDLIGNYLKTIVNHDRPLESKDLVEMTRIAIEFAQKHAARRSGHEKKAAVLAALQDVMKGVKDDKLREAIESLIKEQIPVIIDQLVIAAKGKIFNKCMWVCGS